MRGGKLLNNWRMAELHAKEAPERVYELEQWGALFDRTADGKISQRDFGGHRYARLAHVGDRTGLEMIRALQQRAVSLGMDVFMELTVTDLLKDGDKIAGAFGYWRESGRFVVLEAPAVILATGGIGKSWKVTSNSWECTGDGHALALRSGATLLNMEFVQFHPTGMVWPLSVRGLLVTESVRGDGGVLLNSEHRRFMFDYIPEFFKAETADNIEEADRWYEDKRNNRRPPELLPRDEVARAINSEIKAGRGSPHGGSIPRHRQPAFARFHQEAFALHVPAVPRAGGRRHHQGSDGDRADVPLRHGRRRGGRRQPGHRWSPGFSPPARWRAGCTAPTAWAAIRFRICSCSASGQASTPPSTPKDWVSNGRKPAQADVARGRRSRPGAVPSGPAAEVRTRTRSTRSSRRLCRTSWA